MKMIRKICVLLMCMTILMGLSVSTANAASKKIEKVKASSIVYTGSSADYKAVSFEWRKVKGAKGYQVRLIDRDRYDHHHAVKIYLSAYTRRSHIYIDLTPIRRGTFYRVQVRAYKTKRGRIIYSKWSTSKKSFSTIIN